MKSEDPFGKSEGGNKYYGQFPYDDINTVFQFPDPSYDIRGDSTPFDATQGTVWDLIPDTKRSLYPHQRDAFEFIWKNIAGGLRIDELDDSSKILVQVGASYVMHQEQEKPALQLSFCSPS